MLTPLEYELYINMMKELGMLDEEVQLEFDFSGMGVPRLGVSINSPNTEEWDPQF